MTEPEKNQGIDWSARGAGRTPEALLSRRRILLAGGALLGLSVRLKAFGMGAENKFVFAQLRYNGGNWKPYAGVGPALLAEISRRTSVEVELEPFVCELNADALVEHPMLYVAGDSAFAPFGKEQRRLLRNYCTFGGLLLIDSAAPENDDGFDRSVRRELAAIFPRNELEMLDTEHSVYRSFYRLERAVGRSAETTRLDGVTIGRFTPVIYSRCDLGGAWAQDTMGFWLKMPTPGGEAQRRESIRVGVNVISYALTSDYKLDQVHLDYLRRRGRWP